MTPFEQAVDGVLLSLAPGDVVTYGEVAEEAGFPGRARLVGRVLSHSEGRYPWWRVVSASGRLVVGLEEQQAQRLAQEGVETRDGRLVGMAAKRRTVNRIGE